MIHRVRTGPRIALLGTVAVLTAVVTGGVVALAGPEPAAGTAGGGPVVADSYVSAKASTSNYGSSTSLKVDSSAYRALLRFDTTDIPTSGTVNSVELRLYATNSATTGGIRVHPASNDWDEAAVTWSNQPAWDATVLATSGATTRKTWFTIALPVEAVTRGGQTSLGLDYSVSGTAANVASRESSGQAPQLLVDYDAPTAPTPTVVTGDASDTTSTSTVLHGTAADNGSDTSCAFDYGTSTAYGSTTAAGQVPSGSGTTQVSTPVDGLQSGTTYDYRLACTNAAGTAYGANATFTTGSTAPAPSSLTKVMWIMEENLSESRLMSSPDLPYLRQLAGTYGLLANLHNESKPSLPNYLALLSGSTHGVADDSSPSAHPLTGPTIFSQLPPGEAMTFAETMPGNCYAKNGPAEDVDHGGSYAVRHTGWPYFVDAGEQALCQQYQVDLRAALPARIDGGLPAFSEVAPALCNDLHRGQLSNAPDGCNFDSVTGPNLQTRAEWWLQTWLPRIMAGPDYRAGRLAVFILWDEGSGSGSTLGMDCTTSSLETCHPPAIVVSPYTHQVVSNTRYTHYDVLRTTEELLGIHDHLGQAAGASSFAGEFGLTGG